MHSYIDNEELVSLMNNYIFKQSIIKDKLY